MSALQEKIISGVNSNTALPGIYSSLNGSVSKSDFYKTVLSLIEKGLIPNVLICFCGYDCSKCRTYIATLNDDNDMRSSISQYYKSELNIDIPIEKLYCLSGRSDTIMEACNGCPFTKCCHDKNLNSCSECPQYPCAMIADYEEKYVNKSNQL